MQIAEKLKNRRAELYPDNKLSGREGTEESAAKSVV
jgi:hypothetical protein